MSILRTIFSKISGRSEADLRNDDLCAAAFQGQLPRIAEFLSEGADIEGGVANGLTPLYLAAKEGHADVVRLLLEKGASPNAGASGDISGTALTQAAAHGHMEIVRMLVAAKADLQATSYEWRTALHEAVWHGHEEIAVVLADAGTATDTRSRLGGTPLQDALEWDKRDAALALCRNGADATVTDKCDMTLREKARQKGWTDVVAAMDDYKKDREEAQLRRIEEERRSRDAIGAAIESAPVLQRDLTVGRRLTLKSVP